MLMDAGELAPSNLVSAVSAYVDYLFCLRIHPFLPSFLPALQTCIHGLIDLWQDRQTGRPAQVESISSLPVPGESERASEDEVGRPAAAGRHAPLYVSGLQLFK